VKRLLLIPTLVVTMFLALAFVAPGTAKGLIGSVAPVLKAAHLNLPAVGMAENGVAPSASTSARAEAGRTPQPFAPVVPQTNTTQSGVHRGDAVATAGHVNCGRLGNGFHGGKHDFICPNKVFPPGS
jgi:hypothetical protein